MMMMMLMMMMIHFLCLPNTDVEIGFESRNEIKIVEVGAREYGVGLKGKNKATWCIKMVVFYPMNCVYTFWC